MLKRSVACRSTREGPEMAGFRSLSKHPSTIRRVRCRQSTRGQVESFLLFGHNGSCLTLNYIQGTLL